MEDKYKAIRPLNPDEIAPVVEQLLANDTLRKAFESMNPGIAWDNLKEIMKTLNSTDDFKQKVAYHIVYAIAKRSTFSLEGSGLSKLDNNKAYTYISNHRDIILDSAFINVLLFDAGKMMPEIAIGDNLMVAPWVESLVKLNASFLVKRNLQGREVLLAAKELSEYMQANILDKNRSQWIAQREGRAKDSNDKTQVALLKMLSLASKSSNPFEALKTLNIVPVTCSYEYDPCDYLKAQEMQLKRDTDYKKTKADDAINMLTGLNGYKGRVHITINQALNTILDKLDLDSVEKGEELNTIASLMDKEIYKGYRLYPNNYIAYDLLFDTDKYRNNYSDKEKSEFESYISKQIDKIELGSLEKDIPFLRNCILTMYANPTKNHHQEL